MLPLPFRPQTMRGVVTNMPPLRNVPFVKVDCKQGPNFDKPACVHTLANSCLSGQKGFVSHLKRPSVTSIGRAFALLSPEGHRGKVRFPAMQDLLLSLDQSSFAQAGSSPRSYHSGGYKRGLFVRQKKQHEIGWQPVFGPLLSKAKFHGKRQAQLCLAPL